MSEIEIEILGISSELQIQFFEEFSRRLNNIHIISDINDSISKSIITTLYKRPTDRH